MEDRPPVWTGSGPSDFDPPPPAAPALPPIPWEQPGKPWLTGLWETLQLLFSRPREAYARIPLDTDLLRPLLFGVLFGCIGFGVNALYEMAYPTNSFWPGMHDMPLGRGFWLAMAALSPLNAVVGLFLNAAFFHVALLLTGGGGRGFGATLRTICYTSGVYVLGLIPFCGVILLVPFWIVHFVVALSTVHRISMPRAVLVLVLPALVCCTCIAIGSFLFGAAIYGMMKNHGMP